jgi:hypothetical protein
MQTYLLTVAPQLERLGHHVTLYAPQPGLMSDVARSRGLRVADGEHELPDDCDAVIASDAITMLAMADRYPTSVRVLVVHSAELDVHLPPGIDGTVSRVVALNDAVERRVKAMPARFTVHRLHQPVDTDRYRLSLPGPEQPQRVLILSHYILGAFRDDLVRVCEDAGLEWRQVGQYGETLTDPTPAINDADIVIGQGRSVLDAMACGRAAWVYGPIAGDGWVTELTYPALEADGFRGRATEAIHDAGTFERCLKEYDPAMGLTNRKLITLHHSAYEHAIGLVEILDAAPAGRRVDAPLRELARTIRTQFDAQAATELVTREGNERLHRARLDHQTALADARTAHEEHGALLEENARLTREIAALRGQHQLVTGSRRWQLTSRALRPLEILRQFRNGR